jgi:hypothetical protein
MDAPRNVNYTSLAIRGGKNHNFFLVEHVVACAVNNPFYTEIHESCPTGRHVKSPRLRALVTDPRLELGTR